MRVLHLTLKKKWFDMIASGEKVHEYREIKPYWEKRFIDENKNQDISLSQFRCGFGCKDFDFVIAKNGYGKNAPTIKWEHRGIVIDTGVEEWGAEPNKKYFCLVIGKVEVIS